MATLTETMMHVAPLFVSPSAMQEGTALSPGQLAGLELQARVLALKTSDLTLRLGQLREQQASAPPSDRIRFNSDIAQAQHAFVASQLELEATQAKIRDAKSIQSSIATTAATREPLFGRHQLEEGMAGAVVLLLPISFALARRLWMRAGRAAAALPDEDSQRLRRLEQAVESIAVEVERIGEGQRFTTKLLSERPELAPRHDTPSKVPIARREIGTITPH